MKTKTYTIGDRVVCDLCDTVWTDRPETGGFLFVSKAVCPDCAEAYLRSIAEYGEEHYIHGYCPPRYSFADWIRERRGPQGGQITVTTAEPGESFDDLIGNLTGGSEGGK